jgi:hypothetical protein
MMFAAMSFLNLVLCSASTEAPCSVPSPFVAPQPAQMFLATSPPFHISLQENGCCRTYATVEFGRAEAIPIGELESAQAGNAMQSFSGTPRWEDVLPDHDAVFIHATRLVDDAPDEAGLKVFCSKPNHGVPCAERCYAKNIACGPIASHPFKSGAGLGKLFSCNDLVVGFMCGYHYPNGDDCYYPFGLPFPKVCSYSGND